MMKLPEETTGSTELLVVAMDHTPAGGAALRWALQEADRRDARLLTVHVSEQDVADRRLERDPDGEVGRAAIRLHDQVVQRSDAATAAVPVAVSVVAGTLVDRLVKAAERASLLVIGQPQSEDHARLPDALALHSPCPVMVVDPRGLASEIPRQRS